MTDSSFPEVRNFNGTQEEFVPRDNFVAPLTDLGLIAFSGEDAAHFLHNQLTNDIQHLSVRQARRAGYCTAKGRLLATFLIWKSGDTLVLQLPRPILTTIQRRLQMFVLRAKAKSDDVTDSHVILGIASTAAAAFLSRWFPVLPAEPYAKVDSTAGVLLRVDDALGAPRYQWITTQAVAENAWPALTAVLRPVGSNAWRLGDIYAGIPQITQATQERFIPQMVNFELVGGVSFKKGCYPGQEIVARSHYLGKLKRRMKLALVETQDATPGMEVFSVT
ncbi:MAG TPA: folate-binding protein, partial [Burkholderiaceae bacterium]|nr:folate-binding protein [Burkholderiaceae bacterium]